MIEIRVRLVKRLEFYWSSSSAVVPLHTYFMGELTRLHVLCTRAIIMAEVAIYTPKLGDLVVNRIIYTARDSTLYPDTNFIYSTRALRGLTRILPSPHRSLPNLPQPHSRTPHITSPRNPAGQKSNHGSVPQQTKLLAIPSNEGFSLCGEHTGRALVSGFITFLP